MRTSTCLLAMGIYSGFEFQGKKIQTQGEAGVFYSNPAKSRRTPAGSITFSHGIFGTSYEIRRTPNVPRIVNPKGP